MTSTTIHQQVQVTYHYPVVFSENVFALGNETLANIFHRRSAGTVNASKSDDVPRSPKVLLVIDANLAQLQPQIPLYFSSYAAAHHLNVVTKPLVVEGGEGVKTDPHILPTLYQLVADKKIDRHSYILVVGGGAVLDAVGYVAATAHRGIRLVRMPSTVLAQNDAGIGVKNAVNYLNRKNFLGTFAPPFAVVNDFSLLASLSERDKRAGIAEAIKVALIKDGHFFDDLYNDRHALAAFDAVAVNKMIFRCAQLHLDHIATSGDPFEMGSARPLDFGHWSAHKLEALSQYRIRHGEAVATGIALDVLYCHRLNKITDEEAEKIWFLLKDLGFDLFCEELNELNVMQSLEEFREHLGGVLTITLLDGIGKAFETNEIDAVEMAAARDQLSQFGKSASFSIRKR